MREEDLNYFEEPDFKRALEKYENALANNSSVYLDADELTDIAEYYMTKGQEDKADEAIQLALDLHPESVDPQIFLSRQQMFYGNMERAHEICDSILDQNDREVHFLKAELMIRDQKAHDASLYLKGVYEKTDEDKALFLCDATEIFMDYDLWKIAQAWCNKMNQDFPHYKPGLRLYPEILIGLGDYPKAVNLLNKLLDEEPFDINLWNLLAESNASLENYREAIDNCEYVLAIDEGNQRATILKANCLFHLNLYEDAHALYQKYLEENPKDPTIHYLNAVCLSNMERYEEAAVELRIANKTGDEMAPEQIHIYLEQAYVEGKLHHLETAQEALDNARDLMTDDVTFEYDLILGKLFLENGKHAQAVERFKLAVDHSSHKANTLLSIAISYSEVQMYHDALDILQGMEKLFGESEYPQIYPYIAFCYYKGGDKKNYLKYLKESVHLNSEVTEYLVGKEFPGVSLAEYYMYAFRQVWGRFPQENE